MISKVTLSVKLIMFTSRILTLIRKNRPCYPVVKKFFDQWNVLLIKIISLYFPKFYLARLYILYKLRPTHEPFLIRKMLVFNSLLLLQIFLPSKIFYYMAHNKYFYVANDGDYWLSHSSSSIPSFVT